MIAELGLSVLLLLALPIRKSAWAAELTQLPAQAEAQTATRVRIEGGLQTMANAQEVRRALASVAAADGGSPRPVKVRGD